MTRKSDYIYVKNELSDLKPDQTVVGKTSLFQFYPGVKKVAPEVEVELFPLASAMVDPGEWYPAVNSYYPFTEDVDAFARVHQLRETRHSSDSLEKETKLQINEYSEKRALTQYLRSRPLSFLILGKPNFGEEELGKRLAEFWSCVYIDPLTLLQEEIESESRPGQCIEFNLRCGRSIGIDILNRLLAMKVQSPYVLHRGFVLSGFPLIPNDLYEEDPISSESAVFTVKEIFEDIVDHSIHIVDTSTKMVVSMVGSKDEIEMEKYSESEEMPDPLTVSTGFSLEWSIENEICVPGEIASDLEKQVNCVFGVFEDPFMIIYVHGKNSDVVSKRDNYAYDVHSTKTIDMQKIRMFNEQGAANEDLTGDVFDTRNNPFAENPTLEYLVKLPENFPSNVITQLDRYHNNIADLLDCRVLQHTIEHFIKVDGRSFISQMLKLVILRLTVLPFQRVLVPTPFLTPYEEIGEDFVPNELEKLTPEEAFPTLARQEIPQPIFKWTWSNWRSFCPVFMSRGIYQKGLPKYAVHFGDKIYFMANERNYYKFIANPRSYLLPPFPKPDCSIFVFGPPVSGKSAVSKCLGYLLNSKVLNPSEMHREYVEQIADEYKDHVKQIAIAEALEILKEKVAVRVDEIREQIEQWKNDVRGRLRELEALLSKREKESHVTMSSFPMKMESERVSDETLYNENIIRTSLQTLNIPKDIDEENCIRLLESESSLIQFLPEDLKKEPSMPSVLDPFVLDYANAKVEGIQYDEMKKKVAENMFEMYTRCIRNFQQQSDYDGCIIDGMETDVTLLQSVCEEFSIQDIVILATSNYDFLVERFKRGDKCATRFRDYRKFFLDNNEVDAAWRVPSDLSTESFKKEIAEGCLSQILTSSFPEEVVDAERQYSADRYHEALLHYDKEIINVRNFFDEIGLLPVVVDVQDFSMENLIKEVIGALRDKYRIQASEFTEADRAEEIQMFLAQTAGQAVEGEVAGALSDEFLAANRRYGDSYYYDAVCFSEKFVLWRGKEQFAAKFKDKVYLFATEQNKNRFIKAPRRYLRQFDPPERFPSPRICVMGANAQLATRVAQRLAQNVGVRWLDFETIRKQAVDALSSTSLLFEPEGERDLPDSLIFGWYTILFEKLFTEEPYLYIGFVLDGFPVKARDMNCMCSEEAIPDTIIYVHLSAEENMRVELERALTQWREDMEILRKQQDAINFIIFSEWEEKRKIRYNELIDAKRQSRYSKTVSEVTEETTLPQIQEEPDDQGLLSETQISVDSVIEQQEQDEVMKMLDEELPEPVFEQNLETEEEAKKQFETDIEEKYNTKLQYRDEVKTICDAQLIPFVEIDGNQEFEKVVRHAFIAGNVVKFRSESLFERCYDVSQDVAEKLLISGYFFISYFGRFCPVQCYEGHNTLHMYLCHEAKGAVFPVIHRNYIYFLHGKTNRRKFFDNPLRYTTVKQINITLVPVLVAIIGPPKSGKTTLAKRFQRDMGFRTVNRGEAIRYVLSNPLYANLIAMVESVLRKGEELPDELVMDCVFAASFCGEHVTQGLVLDGFPNTIAEVTALSRLGLVPHVIFDLQITGEALHKQAANPSDKTPQYSRRFIDHLCEEWQKGQQGFRLWSDREYQNVYKLAIDRSIWGVSEQAREVTLAAMFERKYYYEHAKFDVPLRLTYMLITPLEFLERQGAYQTYCPACIFYDNQLVNGGDPPDRTGLIHYRKYFYWLCENHIEEFITAPEKFLPPSNETLPQHLPEVVKLTEEPEDLVDDGYCLVCYRKNFPKKVLNRGCLDHVVLYRDKYYMFDDVQCMKAFLALPQKVSQVTINFRESISKSLSYKDLPVLGMLEQYVAKSLIDALNKTNTCRPVVPGLSVAQSALIFVGLNLKVFNPKTRYKKEYEEALHVFHKKRLKLIRYLDVMKKYLNPYVHYEEPDFVSEDEGSEASK